MWKLSKAVTPVDPIVRLVELCDELFGVSSIAMIVLLLSLSASGSLATHGDVSGLIRSLGLFSGE